MKDKEAKKRFDKEMREIIEEEMTPQGDLLPVWLRYPQIQRYSMGWRMGYGESYMWAWDVWADSMQREQLVAYFKRYLPIPLDWIDWVADRLGFPSVGKAIVLGEGGIEDVLWLEEQGLVNYSEFKDWFASHKK